MSENQYAPEQNLGRAMSMSSVMEDESGGVPQYLFKKEVRSGYLKKEGITKLYILPSRPYEGSPDLDNKLAWLPYRMISNGRPVFTRWIQPFRVYRFVAGIPVNVICPRTFDNSGLAKDPLDDLYKFAKSVPQWAPLAGFTEDLKKDPKAFENKTQKIRPSDQMYAVNAYNPENTGEHAGLCQVYMLPATAVAPQQAKAWGLIARLEQMNRGVHEGVAIDDWNARYYWGDITNPGSLALCLAQKRIPPAGGREIYDMEPTDSANIVPSVELMSSRYELMNEQDPDRDIFVRMTPAETVELCFDLFKDYPGMLRGAFEHKYPGTDSLLKKYGATSDSVVHVSRPEPIPASSPGVPAPAYVQTPTATSERTFVRTEAPATAHSAQSFTPPVNAAKAFAAATPVPARTESVAAPLAGAAPVPGVSQATIEENRKKVAAAFKLSS